jgi:penicillin-binding protein 2
MKERGEDPDPLFQIPKFQFGKTGVEAKFEDQLRGQAGTQRIEVNAVGRVMRELSREEGTPGTTSSSPSTPASRPIVEARMEGESAAAVVIDCATGDLLAWATRPSFDPNLFVRGISGPDWRALNEDIYRPLSAKAVQGAYPPGSTFKMVTALAAFEAGVLSPDETVYCPGFTRSSGIRFHCWKKGGPRQRQLPSTASCFLRLLLLRGGPARRASRPSPAWPRSSASAFRPTSPCPRGRGDRPQCRMEAADARRRCAWATPVNASIGQGYVLATPLPARIMSARIATGPRGDAAPRQVDQRGRSSPRARAILGAQREHGCAAARLDVRRRQRLGRHGPREPHPARRLPHGGQGRARPRCAASPPRSARAA